jgi:phage FluMu protein Com
MEGFPDVSCPRCHELNGPLYTVPIYLPATESGWQSLCAACFRLVLKAEPTADMAVRPVKRAHRSRR